MSRTENRVFLPQGALDKWMGDGVVDLQDGELTLLAEGRRYRLSEAIRVLVEVSGSGDPLELGGRVKVRRDLEQLGAEIVETSMLLGEAAYDVEPGWVGVPVGSFAEHMVSQARTAKDVRKTAPGGRTRTEPTSDEELLSCFLSNKT